MRKASSYKEKDFYGACDCLTKIFIVCHTKFVDSDIFDKLWTNIITNPSIVDIEFDLFMEQSGYTFIEQILVAKKETLKRLVFSSDRVIQHVY